MVSLPVPRILGLGAAERSRSLFSSPILFLGLPFLLFPSRSRLISSTGGGASDGLHVSGSSRVYQVLNSFFEVTFTLAALLLKMTMRKRIISACKSIASTSTSTSTRTRVSPTNPPESSNLHQYTRRIVEINRWFCRLGGGAGTRISTNILLLTDINIVILDINVDVNI
ncbi:hypothetical protein BJX62DRAFT_201028 [Aspergillus germanicus]